jgi:hypothetical protein
VANEYADLLPEQIYDSTVTQMSACLLALAVLSLLIPVGQTRAFSE